MILHIAKRELYDNMNSLRFILRACLKKKKLSERLMFTFTHWSS